MGRTYWPYEHRSACSEGLSVVGQWWAELIQNYDHFLGERQHE